MKRHDLKTSHGILNFVRSIDYPYTTSGIYPSEMAYFLYCCEKAGVDCIIESGRHHGYSTAVISAYGEERGVSVVSIDLELDKDVATHARQRLSRFRNLELLTGDSFIEMPKMLKTHPGRIALLIDGPKFDHAVYLSACATAFANVVIVAHHNVHYGDSCYEHFCSRFPDSHRLEESELFKCESFAEFREWERQWTSGTHRDLDRTTLLTSILPKAGPNRAVLRGRDAKQTLKAELLFLGWKLGTPFLRIVTLPSRFYIIARGKFGLVLHALRTGRT